MTFALLPKTYQGLSVTVSILDTRLVGGMTVSKAFEKNMPIVFEKLHPGWGY
jgi:hypothetical protein